MDSSAASQLLYLKIASYSIVSRIRHLMVTVKGPYWILSSQPDLISIYDAHIILQQTIILPHGVFLLYLVQPPYSIPRKEGKRERQKKKKKLLQIIDGLMMWKYFSLTMINDMEIPLSNFPREPTQMLPLWWLYPISFSFSFYILVLAPFFFV